MSIKTILVHADPGPGCDRRVALAAQLADRFAAGLVGVGAEAFDPILTSGDPVIDGGLIAAVRKRIEENMPAAEKHFRDLTAGRAGLNWVSAEDYPDRVLALYARGADLVVSSRPGRHEATTCVPRPADLIMEAGTPVLMAADGDAPLIGERVVIGWRDKRESRRALTDSLPFLKRAKSVVLALVNGEAGMEADQTALRDVLRRLAAHGIDASVEMVVKGRGTIADALEEAATRRGADLIVVGAYGHSRLREWALGGVTEDFVAASSKHVLFSH